MKWMLCISLAIALIALIALMVDDAGAAATTKPTDAKFASCVTSECHASLKASALVHAPVASGACDACHEMANPNDHTFALIRKGAEMCTYCHEFDVSALPVVHKPVATGECLGCHDPHGAKGRGLLREDSVPELCGRCHESLTQGHDFAHTPVARGECDTCHPPHASRFPKLLDAVGADLCLACHKDLEQRMASLKFSHKAMTREGGCLRCHNVHASDHPNELTLAPPELCTQCHDKVQREVAEATVKHRVTSEDQACVTCHAPHGSDYAALMSDLPSKICMSCHGEKIPGLDMAAVPEVKDPKLVKHGPIREGQCSGCHSSHGGTRPAMLTQQYSDKFYQIFDGRQYALCFSCHDQRLATDRLTTVATAFRNGSKNLHVLHISEGDKGRGCSVCHAVHAANNDRMVRATMHFGQRELPINFERTATGGMCQTGCHVTYAYDRVNAVALTTQPTTRPRPAIARAEPDKPQRIEWTGSDIAGRTVHLPVADRPTVLVMLRTFQAENTRVAKLLESALDRRAPSQVVVLISGMNAVAQARQFQTTAHPSWRIVADPLFRVADQVSVRGWPTIVMLRADGLAVARIGGLPESLPVRLGAYVDLASDRTNRKMLEQQLATGDPPQVQMRKKVQLLLQEANRLLGKDQPEPAEKLIDAALKLQPGDRPLLVARAKMLIHTDRWDQAKDVLSDVLKNDATIAEAHWLMGHIYEREQNWQSAAKEYRIMHELRSATRPALAN